MSETRISGKVLAQINMPDFCPKCFYLNQKVKSMPYMIWPGIFNSIDSWSKKVVHAWFDQNNCPPPWIPALDGAVRYMKTPHWSKFKRTDPVTGITVSGAMDDLFERKDGLDIIPDYKTAKYTANADKLHPLYAGQLNSYKWIHEGTTRRNVHSLPLIYCEPVTDVEACTPEIFTPDGFNMGFSVHIEQVEMVDGLVEDLLVKAANIIELDSPPVGADGCNDCEKLDNLIQVIGG